MTEQTVIDALNDLARIVIACDDRIETKADAITRLHMAAVKPSRIAHLLSLPTKDVTSKINKLNKKAKDGNGKFKGGRKVRSRG